MKHPFPVPRWKEHQEVLTLLEQQSVRIGVLSKGCEEFHGSLVGQLRRQGEKIGALEENLRDLSAEFRKFLNLPPHLRGLDKAFEDAAEFLANSGQRKILLVGRERQKKRVATSRPLNKAIRKWVAKRKKKR